MNTNIGNIQLSNLNKIFGTTEVLKNINLNIKGGEFLILVGPSGCGKSTLMNLIAGLEEATSGLIMIDGKNVSNEPPKDRNIAMVFQSYALYPTMSVARNISFGLEMRDVPKVECKKIVAEVAKLLQITHLLDRKPGQLSGGQRQRVAMGRALARSPKVFLFDEPLSNLDAKLRVEMRTEIKKLHQRLGATIVYVTHDQIEAMTLADKIVVLKEGEIQQIGTPYEIYNNPVNQFVASFMGSPSMNFIQCRVLDGKIIINSADKEYELSIPCTRTLIDSKLNKALLGIRPEMMTEPKPYNNNKYVHEIDFYVKVVEPMGADTLATGQWNNNEVQARLSPESGKNIVDKFRLQVDTSKVVLFNIDTGERI